MSHMSSKKILWTSSNNFLLYIYWKMQWCPINWSSPISLSRNDVVGDYFLVDYHHTLFKSRVSQNDPRIFDMHKVCTLLHTYIGLVLGQNINGNVEVRHKHYNVFVLIIIWWDPMKHIYIKVINTLRNSISILKMVHYVDPFFLHKWMIFIWIYFLNST